MKINTLKLRIETIKNAKNATKAICIEYGFHASDTQIQCDDKNIILTILGKNILIPYYSVELGSQDASDIYNPVYDSAKVESLSIEEIKEKIMKVFTFECRVKDQ